MIVVVPMAGRGSRFAGAVPDRPKPLIEIHGKPMFQWALQSLDGVPFSRIVFVVLDEHERLFGVSAAVRRQFEGRAVVLTIPRVTEGQLCTVLAAREIINTDEDLLIASSDTLVVSRITADIAGKSPECRGIISVAHLPGDRWSFARTDESGSVVEVSEKQRISDNASTGLYYFTHGRDLVEVGEEMIDRMEKTRGEYYVIPVYQKFIERGWRVTISRATEMWDMGTPEAMREFMTRKGVASP